MKNFSNKFLVRMLFAATFALLFSGLRVEAAPGFDPADLRRPTGLSCKQEECPVCPPDRPPAPTCKTCKTCAKCPPPPACPTPTPKPTPEPDQCPVGGLGKLTQSIDNEILNGKAKHKNNKRLTNPRDIFSGDLNHCMEKLIGKLSGLKMHQAKVYNDDQYGAFIERMKGFVCTGSWILRPHSIYIDEGDGKKKKVESACSSGHLVYNPKTCEPATQDEINKCKIVSLAHANIELSTPISLLWGEPTGDSSGVPVYGSLDMSGEKSWLLWKASESAPLLVFDPEKTGVVSSPVQLFGNWAFGGKKTASLSSSASVQPSPWKHGYEALATLDSNGNGKVDGEELSSLSLWFDKNRNAVSEEGEVIPVTELGITVIHYNVDPSVEGGLERDIQLQIGYERVKEDGTVLVGASVDWYTPKLASPAEVMRYLNMVSIMDEPKYDSGLPEEVDFMTEEVSSYGKSTPGSVQGQWNWRIEGEVQHEGLFVFNSFEEDAMVLDGYSISSSEVSGEKESSLISSVYLRGKKRVNENGFTELSFASANIRGVKLKSTAILSKDGKSMKGKTVVLGDFMEEESTAEYSWTAIKE